MTLDLAARVSAGKAFPDGAECEPAGVVLLSAEDGLADTIRPRLDAAGADTSKILALATVPDENGHDRLLSIPEDLALIEKGIRRVGARLVVVDPLMAFLSVATPTATATRTSGGLWRRLRDLRRGPGRPCSSSGT